MTRCPAVRHAGVTLAEMLVVVAILGIVAVIAIPQASSLSPATTADAAAAEIARALRFAQREAVRTNNYCVVSIDPATQALRVDQPTPAGDTAPVTHPIDKRDYQIRFGGNSMLRATLVSSVFKYEGGFTSSYALFGPDGMPVYVDKSAVGQLFGLLLGTKEIKPLKEEAKITVRYGNVERVVRIAPVTARVSL
ncbi:MULTISPECIES: prepilin-type N-terminal cleavage/methylation domain-containing protein [unclassified Massilia]|uniref:pilus assembly FimT family protein n=1 Tax=unclassified Massilia TaxID=2609279 RepID=UPI00177B6E4D|nr:prepilin-type N-terminal cleavage/methylation domain-containing protein [Massilia sp. CFBP 13647]MBD8675179.1 prepilin-type N-terminal cleavage/methylation domain-containing protein [Massilia sp. CFBP 13721]